VSTQLEQFARLRFNVYCPYQRFGRCDLCGAEGVWVGRLEGGRIWRCVGCFDVDPRVT
jgi:Zn-finger protein